jgi:hypothetical protein
MANQLLRGGNDLWRMKLNPVATLGKNLLNSSHRLATPDYNAGSRTGRSVYEGRGGTAKAGRVSRKGLRT